MRILGVGRFVLECSNYLCSKIFKFYFRLKEVMEHFSSWKDGIKSKFGVVSWGSGREYENNGLNSLIQIGMLFWKPFWKRCQSGAPPRRWKWGGRGPGGSESRIFVRGNPYQKPKTQRIWPTIFLKMGGLSPALSKMGGRVPPVPPCGGAPGANLPLSSCDRRSYQGNVFKFSS